MAIRLRKLIPLGLCILFLGSCKPVTEQDQNKLKPKACAGEANFSRPTGQWKITQYDQKENLTKTLRLGIGTAVTEIGIECSRGTLSLSTSKVVESDFDDEYLSVDKTGVIEVARDGLVCRLEEMGGVYDIKYGGDCLVLKNSKGTMYLVRDTFN